MESEKVKEIKKALECCLNPKLNCCNDCPYNNNGRLSCLESEMLKDALTLINELESENKELRVVVNIANERTYRKKFTDEWRKEYQKELDKQGNGHIAGFPDFDLVYKLYFEQKDRIAELKSENELLRSKQEQSEKIVYGSLITSTKCYNCIHFPLCFAQKGGANLELASDCCYYQPKHPEDSVVHSKEQKQ